MRLKRPQSLPYMALCGTTRRTGRSPSGTQSPHWSEIHPESARSRFEYPALVGNFSLFMLIFAFMPESVATTVVFAYGVGNRLLDGLEGPDRRYLSPR
jgi:hypothetical protein